MAVENEFRIVADETGVAGTGSYTAITWTDYGGQNYIDYTDAIVGTVLLEETAGGGAAFDYKILHDGHEFASGTVSASTKAAPIQLTMISSQLSIEVKNNTGSATITARVRAK